jgi:hypothetical protein
MPAKHVNMISNAANAYGRTTQIIRSRGKIGMDISTNRQIRKMGFSIFGGEDDVDKKASK